MDELLDVPSHFLCPIALQLMVDPVTISTGITYDRDNIEKWLYSLNNNTCPVTRQELIDKNVIPNYTLKRLINKWCSFSTSSDGTERIDNMAELLSVDEALIPEIIRDAKAFPCRKLKDIKKLGSIVCGSRFGKFLEDASVVEFLASIIQEAEAAQDKGGAELSEAINEALSTLYHLDPSKDTLKSLMKYGHDFADSLIKILKHGEYQSRAYATILLRSLYGVADPIQLISIKPELFVQISRVLGDRISQQASKAALKLLVELCPWGRNRIRAVEGGAVSVLIELLLDTTEKRACELVLNILDLLCACAEGRAEFLKHGAGLAIVSKKILRISHVASDRAVRILSSVSRCSGTPRVLQDMLQVGVVSKLCVLLQVDSSFKTKERAKEILKLHSSVWRNSSCIPPHLLSSYPLLHACDKQNKGRFIKNALKDHAKITN